MLTAMRQKMFDWKVKRTEKQFAQLRHKNEKLARYIARSLKENEQDITTVKQESNSATKRLCGVNE